MPLTPWREIVTPHPDIAAGRYHQAEFAANLGEVIAGNADAEYQDPIEFFARTYLTAGMRRLLATSVKQITGKDGEPIVQLKTAFGGGKTHSMLALYHLLRGKANVTQMEGAGSILKQADVTELPTARFAVIVGTTLNPSRTQRVNGITTRTLWGNIAAQLGGQGGYAIVQAADKKSVAPGANDLTTLLNEFGPAIVLIDELVAYTRNIYGVNGLPAGSFDANLTFVQSLTEAVKNAERSQLVASIPESDIEIGGEAGQAALERIQQTIGRLEGVWRPVDADEGFEIVRRRLFLPVKDETTRDAVCRGFTKLYDENPSDFPVECRETPYLDRLRRAYPLHPELFDRLYDDWSPLENFQKTRGVLRFMAAVIHHLWINEDRAPLILPALSLLIHHVYERNSFAIYQRIGTLLWIRTWMAVVPSLARLTKGTHGSAKSPRRDVWHVQSSWEARHMEVGKPCAVLKKCGFASVSCNPMSMFLCSMMQPNV